MKKSAKKQATKKIKVGIIFGGKSVEHEISLLSAKNVIDALDKTKYEPRLIGIDKSGNWLLQKDAQLLLDAKFFDNKDKIFSVTILPESGGMLVATDNSQMTENVDVIFPMIHGSSGEDGTLQGVLKIADVPFVGAGILGSAIGMDKDVMKRLLRDAKIPIANFLSFQQNDVIDYNKIIKQLGSPFFVKPANTGSSVGISKVKKRAEFAAAVGNAFQYDNKIIIEEFIKGREIECAVLGNENPRASIPGEILTSYEFYSYTAKYLDENGTTLAIPAKLTKSNIKKIQQLAVKTFKALECRGLARVDFFLSDNGKIFVNEINTLPGFTKISMYPKLWEHSGISYTELVDKLIELALEQFTKEQLIKNSYLA